MILPPIVNQMQTFRQQRTPSGFPVLQQFSRQQMQNGNVPSKTCTFLKPDLTTPQTVSDAAVNVCPDAEAAKIGKNGSAPLLPKVFQFSC